MYTLAEADEITVQLDEDGYVHILDGEGSIRLTMEYSVWDNLIQDAQRLRAII